MPSSFSLTVGVTGRRFLPEAQLKRITQQVAILLRMVKMVSEDIARKQASLWSQKRWELAVCTCLSEGADRLVAHEALRLGYCIDAALPFAENSSLHARDLDGEHQQASRAELQALMAQARILPLHTLTQEYEMAGLAETPEGHMARHNAYLHAGLLMLERSHVLLALWDGKKTDTVGGTYDIMQQALERKKLVLWIHTEEDTPICECMYEDAEVKAEKVGDITKRLQSFMFDLLPTA